MGAAFLLAAACSIPDPAEHIAQSAMAADTPPRCLCPVSDIDEVLQHGCNDDGVSACGGYICILKNTRTGELVYQQCDDP
jgi:hypothetical protein